MNIINYLDLKSNYILVDVRTLEEHQECCIPGAISIPLFTHEERAEIGTLYKKNTDSAKITGIKHITKRLPQLFEAILALTKQYRYVVLYCERGGMRSSSICSLLNELGVFVYKLEGGYKGYRQLVNDQLEPLIKSKRLYVLHGYTGTGKTEILQRLAIDGLGVLDLEGAADHRGSLLGKVGLKKYVSQKQFEALLFENLRDNTHSYRFIEAESKRIGTLYLHSYFYDTMKLGTHILVEGSMPARAKRIVEDYTQQSNSKEEILGVMDRFRRTLSNETVDTLATLINNDQYYDASILLMEKYYDPLYSHTQDAYSYAFQVCSDDIPTACHMLVKEFL